MIDMACAPMGVRAAIIFTATGMLCARQTAKTTTPKEPRAAVGSCSSRGGSKRRSESLTAERGEGRRRAVERGRGRGRGRG